MLGHDGRYEQAAEWVEVMKRLWTLPGEFDFEGQYYSLRAAAAEPKPIQQPYPPIINAGSSPVARRFAAQHADILFASVSGDDDQDAALIQDIRELARREFGREVVLLGSITIVCRPTEGEARDYWRYLVTEHGDRAAATSYYDMIVANSRIFSPETLQRLREERSQGPNAETWMGSPGNKTLGTPEHIVDRFQRLARSGFDGVTVTFPEFEPGLRQFVGEIMPMLEQAGLRKRFTPPE
jgi:alkanesulfonate monooxygenase SsuD/methylene tetrahydromethanopterin reductase-like flavin-dependent oxidoreductase (luciferase family)